MMVNALDLDTSTMAPSQIDVHVGAVLVVSDHDNCFTKLQFINIDDLFKELAQIPSESEREAAAALGVCFG
jgi:hypothetical protein